MKPSNQETVAAIATPLGQGGLSVIRISGPAALSTTDVVFRGKSRLAEVLGYTAHYGYAVSREGARIDEVVALVFRAPHSYTGEDAVELSCHGGIFVTHQLLNAILDAGARQAQPGEFTKRAFLNGRIDLSQAEAVSDLIAARSHRAHMASLEQLSGKLGKRVHEIKVSLIDLCALLEIDLDFSEEGIELISQETIHHRLHQILRTLDEMTASFEVGRVFREGITVAVVGKPNAGKSSLFNALLHEERAIVTPVPGTTRDSLEEGVLLDGLLFRITDTAGLREVSDVVETEGVARSRAVMKRGEILLLVVDVTDRVSREESLAGLGPLSLHQRLVVAQNKVDLVQEKPPKPEMFEFQGIRGVEVYVSAKTGEGLGELKQALVTLSAADVAGKEGSLFVTNRRHWEALERGRGSLRTALHSLESGATNEFVAFDIRDAVESISEITGEITTEEILNGIFSRFCIGK